MSADKEKAPRREQRKMFTGTLYHRRRKMSTEKQYSFFSELIVDNFAGGGGAKINTMEELKEVI